MQSPIAFAPSVSSFPRILRVTETRIAICGRFGRPAPRTMGAWLFYMSLRSPFEIQIGDGGRVHRKFALVKPWTSHHVSTPDSDIAMLIVEPESVDSAQMIAQLMRTPELQAATAARIRDAFQRPPSEWHSFDTQYFGSQLPSLTLDRRLRHAIDDVCQRKGSACTISECAANARISSSRLMHLFDEQLGIPFRRFRNWKRARSILTRFSKAPRLIEVALDAGYCDSSHFGQQVRSCYGYTPTVMFNGSRQFSVIAIP